MITVRYSSPQSTQNTKIKNNARYRFLNFSTDPVIALQQYTLNKPFVIIFISTLTFRGFFIATIGKILPCKLFSSEFHAQSHTNEPVTSIFFRLKFEFKAIFLSKILRIAMIREKKIFRVKKKKSVKCTVQIYPAYISVDSNRSIQYLGTPRRFDHEKTQENISRHEIHTSPTRSQFICCSYYAYNRRKKALKKNSPSACVLIVIFSTVV